MEEKDYKNYGDYVRQWEHLTSGMNTITRKNFDKYLMRYFMEIDGKEKMPSTQGEIIGYARAQAILQEKGLPEVINDYYRYKGNSITVGEDELSIKDTFNFRVNYRTVINDCINSERRGGRVVKLLPNNDKIYRRDIVTSELTELSLDEVNSNFGYIYFIYHPETPGTVYIGQHKVPPKGEGWRGYMGSGAKLKDEMTFRGRVNYKKELLCFGDNYDMLNVMEEKYIRAAIKLGFNIYNIGERIIESEYYLRVDKDLCWECGLNNMSITRPLCQECSDKGIVAPMYNKISSEDYIVISHARRSLKFNDRWSIGGTAKRTVLLEEMRDYYVDRVGRKNLDIMARSLDEERSINNVEFNNRNNEYYTPAIESDKHGYVYRIINNINGMVYISSSVNWFEHDKYLGCSPAMREALKEHGRENFKKEIISVADSDAELEYNCLLELARAVKNNIKLYNNMTAGHAFDTSDPEHFNILYRYINRIYYEEEFRDDLFDGLVRNKADIIEVLEKKTRFERNIENKIFNADYRYYLLKVESYLCPVDGCPANNKELLKNKRNKNSRIITPQTSCRNERGTLIRPHFDRYKDLVDWRSGPYSKKHTNPEQ